MLDRALLGLLRPPLQRAAQRLAGAGVSADAVTLCGLGFGVAAAVAIVVAQPLLGLAPIGASRLADGLDVGRVSLRRASHFHLLA